MARVSTIDHNAPGRKGNSMLRSSKTNRSAILSAVAASCISAGAMADFSYAFLFGEPGDITKVGSCIYTTGLYNDYRLTTDEDQAGALWHQSKQQVSGGFTTTFAFRIEPGPTNNIEGDGFAFVLHDSPDEDSALGSGGSGIGYAGIVRCIAVEFDTFSFGPPGEFPAQHVSIQTRGINGNDHDDSASLASTVLSDLGIILYPYQDYSATVQYIPADGGNPSRLEVYIESTLVCSAEVDLQDIDGESITDSQGQMYVGFTAATGLADSVHVLTNWALAASTGACASPYWHVFGWGGGGGVGGFYGAGWQVVGTRPMEFQWFKYGVEITDDDFGRIQGLGTDDLSITDFQLTDQGYYHCVATNDCGSIESIRVFLGICPADVDDGSLTGTPDGGVTIEDLIYYLAIFDTGDIRADLDDGFGYGIGDGGVTIEDLLYFLSRFDSGC